MGSIPQVSIMRGPTSTSNLLQNGERLYKLFQKIAEKYPKRVAFLFQDGHGKLKQMTYEELEMKTNRLANALIKEISMKKSNSDGDYIIAIAIGASDILLLTLLAVWKTGCVYLPLDNNAPPERVRHILAESRPILVITEQTDEKESLYKDIGSITYEKLETISNSLSSSPLPDHETLPSLEDPIEIILYTSGSTGLPKGVRIRNSSIKNRLEWQWNIMPYTNDEKYCVFKTALTFVDSVCEIWGPLLYMNSPKTLLIVPKEITVNTQKLIELFEKYRVGRLVLVPSLLRTILLYLNLSKENENLLQYLKLWICSGETLSVSLAEQFFMHFNKNTHTLCNFYGSTEIMGDVTYHIMKSKRDISIDNKVPIGIPLDNTILYLLDKDLRIVNYGEMGELYVSGKNLTAGYVNGRDSFRFIESPHTVDPEYKLLYKTGDFATINKDTIIFEGRTDSQIKVRGHRVDLSEIDSALNQINGIDKAITLCYNAGEIDQQIVSFALLEEDIKSSGEIIENELGRTLPQYALPQVIIVNKMPYLVNGKIDRQYLLHFYKQKAIEEGNLIKDKFDFTGVKNGKQAIAECLFSTILSVLGTSIRSKMTVESNFYCLGGNSLNSVQTISKLRELGYVIGITEFITANNLGEVINKIKHEDDPELNKNDDDLNDGKYKMEVMDDKHKEDVYKIISYSFSTKADIETNMKPPVHISEYLPLMDGIWPMLVKHQVSIVAKNSKNKVIGVSLMFDDFEEPVVELNPPLSYVLEFLDYLEVPIKENILPKGKRLHSFMLGTDEELSAQENIEVTAFLEKEIIKLGKDRNFIGCFSTNTSPLTQQLAEVMNYKPIKTYQVNQYVALNGIRPFKDLSDSVLAISSWKQF